MARTSKQTASALYQLWHGIRDLKEEAESLPDEELLLLIGMLELLIEERAASLAGRKGKALARADTSRPN